MCLPSYQLQPQCILERDWRKPSGGHQLWLAWIRIWQQTFTIIRKSSTFSRRNYLHTLVVSRHQQASISDRSWFNTFPLWNCSTCITKCLHDLEVTCCATFRACCYWTRWTVIIRAVCDRHRDGWAWRSRLRRYLCRLVLDHWELWRCLDIIGIFDSAGIYALLRSHNCWYFVGDGQIPPSVRTFTLFPRCPCTLWFQARCAFSRRGMMGTLA